MHMNRKGVGSQAEAKKGKRPSVKSAGKSKKPTAAVVAHNAIKITGLAAEGTRKRMSKAASDARKAVGGAIKKVGRAVAGDADKRSSGKSKGFGEPMAIPPAGGTTTRNHATGRDIRFAPAKAAAVVGAKIGAGASSPAKRTLKNMPKSVRAAAAIGAKAGAGHDQAGAKVKNMKRMKRVKGKK